MTSATRGWYAIQRRSDGTFLVVGGPYASYKKCWKDRGTFEPRSGWDIVFWRAETVKGLGSRLVFPKKEQAP